MSNTWLIFDLTTLKCINKDSLIQYFTYEKALAYVKRHHMTSYVILDIMNRQSIAIPINLLLQLKLDTTKE